MMNHYEHHDSTSSAGTTITSAMDCARKAWLQELFGGSSSDKAVLGTLQHELVQYALTAAVEQGSVDAQLLEQQVRQQAHMNLRMSCVCCVVVEGWEHSLGGGGVKAATTE